MSFVNHCHQPISYLCYDFTSLYSSVFCWGLVGYAHDPQIPLLVSLGFEFGKAMRDLECYFT